MSTTDAALSRSEMNDQINPKNLDAEKTGGRELMYALGQMMFAVQGPALAELGWSVFPQERGERRRSSVVDGAPLKWGPYQFKAADPATTRRWAMFAPGDNVAVIYGQGSGYTFGFDIDVNDARKAWDIEKLAERILGKTPFRRVGRAPRILLTYRTLPGEIPRSTGYRLLDADGNASDDQIEILGQGKPATFYGLHHKTGQYFKWNGPQPYLNGPEFATLVNKDQIREFLDAVSAEVSPLRMPYTGAPISTGVEDLSYEVSRIGDLVAPSDGYARRIGGVVWDGDLAVDGRETLARDITLFYVRNNPELAKTADGERDLTLAICQQMRRLVASTGAWASAWKIDKVVTEKAQSTCRRLRAGEIAAAPAVRIDETTGRVQRMIVPAVYKPQVETGDYLKALLPPIDQRKRLNFARETTKIISPELLKHRVSQRALLTTDELRMDASAIVARKIAEIERIWMKSDGNALIQSPTGAGKTTTAVRVTVETKLDEIARGEDNGAVVFALPSHANIEEARGKAGKIEKEVMDLAKYARSNGLKVEIMMGRERAGCLNPALKPLIEAGIGSSNLCKSKVLDPIAREYVEKCCPFYAECPVQALYRRVAEADLVFIPHAYLTVNIPKQLKDRASRIIVDERCWTSLLRSTDDRGFTHFELDTLDSYRPGPKPNKTKEAGWTEADLTLQVEKFSSIIRDAISRADKAKRNHIREIELALLDHEVVREDAPTETGSKLCEHVSTIIGRLMDCRDLIRPDITPAEVTEIIAKRSKLPQLLQQKMLAVILSERVRLLEEDRAARRLLTGNEQVALKPNVRGSHDHRLQVVTWSRKDENGQSQEVRGIRLAWRVNRNFEGLPHLFLDASGDEAIMRKLFDAGDHKLNVVKIDAKLHLRIVAVIDSNFSNMSMLPVASKSDSQRLSATRMKTAIRDLFNNVSMFYGEGRVVGATNMCVMNDMNARWVSFENMDWMHFGNLRGFNFAENHMCAVSVGRMELPPRAIDGMVAALTYDDDEPETPIDYLGTGLDASGKEIKVAHSERVIQARDGLDVRLMVPTHAGEWAQRVQKQFREEELRQFIGRLRPVYRQGEAPVAIIAARCIPDDLIVDEFVSIEDLRKPTGARLDLADAVRIYGILDEEILAEVGISSAKGISSEIAKLPKRVLEKAFATYEYEVDGAKKQVLVHLSKSDPEFTIVSGERLRGMDAEDIRLISSPPVVPSERAPRGRFDDLGTRQERHDLWISDREKAVDLAGDKLNMNKVYVDEKTVTPINEWHELVLQGAVDENSLKQTPKAEQAETTEEEIPF